MMGIKICKFLFLNFEPVNGAIGITLVCAGIGIFIIFAASASFSVFFKFNFLSSVFVSCNLHY